MFCSLLNLYKFVFDDRLPKYRFWDFLLHQRHISFGSDNDIWETNSEDDRYIRLYNIEAWILENNHYQIYIFLLKFNILWSCKQHLCLSLFPAVMVTRCIDFLLKNVYTPHFSLFIVYFYKSFAQIEWTSLLFLDAFLCSCNETFYLQKIQFLWIIYFWEWFSLG